MRMIHRRVENPSDNFDAAMLYDLAVVLYTLM